MSNQTKPCTTRSIGVRLPVKVAAAMDAVAEEEFGGGTSEYVRDLVRKDLRARKLMPPVPESADTGATASSTEVVK